MQKFQNKIDAASESRAKRLPIEPTEAVRERARHFDERARKIDLLKQVRAANSGVGHLPQLVFEIVRHRGCWRILHNSKHSSAFDNQAKAIRAAKTLAKEKSELGHRVYVRLIRNDGRLVDQSLNDEHDE